MSIDLAWQKILYATIDDAVSCAVEVTPPHDADLPYVQIGESSLEDFPTGKEMFCDVHTWSSAEGAHEVKTIQHQIREVLHASNHNGDGYNYSCCRELDCRVFRDTDGETWHGVQSFRVFASEV